MAWAKGRSEVKRYMAGLPSEIEKKLLRPAAREMAKVVADEARLRCVSDRVRAVIKVVVKKRGDKILGLVQVKGHESYRATFIEYSTEAHEISVRKAGSLVIEGRFVGKKVAHPGTSAQPFMRPAMDAKEQEALAVGQALINARVRPSGIVGGDDAEVEE